MQAAHARPFAALRVALWAVQCAALGAGVASTAGCAWRSSADPQRASLALESAADTSRGQELIRWPDRYTGDFSPALAGATTTLTQIGLTRPQIGPVEVTHIPVANIVATKVYGQGIVRELERAPEPGLRARLIPDAEFLSFTSLEQATETLADSDMYRIRWSRQTGVRMGVQGTRLEYFAPLPAIEGRPTPAPRGLVVHLGSLGGRAYELPVVEQFRKRGWAVVRLNAATAWEPDAPVAIDDLAALDAPAEKLAASIDNRLAELAYAAEAARAWVAERHPDVPTDRIVVAGFSAGALAAPAVAARIGEPVRAMVLVGAGADILDVSQTSSLTDGGIRIKWPNDARDPDAWEALKTKYLERASLDPYDLAPRFVGTPVLMLHADLDTIVPARTGELMYQRLGKPERWSFPLEHKGIFWRLPAYARDIAVWADKAANPAGGGPAHDSPTHVR